MARQISMATRQELIAAVGSRYRASSRSERRKILAEFVAVTGYHRKHAIRVLAREPEPRSGPQGRSCHRLYDEAVRQALIVLWEASDRICGKRLKAALPLLIGAMEQHGHLALDPIVKQQLLGISAATIDRLLSATREQASGGRKRRSGVGSAIRRSVPIRTFADWKDPPPGYFEADMVEHCGGTKQDGNFVHSLVLTDIATGWTECVALLVRDQTLIVQGFAKVRSDLPFAMRGLDTDNDSAFMNETVLGYCQAQGLELTRSRAYKKNDQAWVEQKNGAIVRRLVGYGRLSGLPAARALAQLYAVSRRYINFFQPSFKLKSKTRDGARVTKRYHAPMTPCERLLSLPSVDEAIKAQLRSQLAQLDPVRLLHDIRTAQHELAAFAAQGSAPDALAHPELATFLAGLSSAWQDGEVRPTHRKNATAPHWWRTREDPFEHSWPMVQRWLEADPGVSAKELMERLAAMFPDLYMGKAQLRTLQRRVKVWRAERAKALIFGHLPSAAVHEVTSEAAAAG
jgi:hypothetical protein